MVGALHALHDGAGVGEDSGLGAGEAALAPGGLCDDEVAQLQHAAQALLVT